MSEAYKCDVKGCGVFSDGSPAAKFLDVSTNQTRALCKTHCDQVIEVFFPDLRPAEEEAPKEEPASTPVEEAAPVEQDGQ